MKRFAKFFIIVFTIIVLLICTVIVLINYNSRVYTKAVIEASDTTVTANDFEKSGKYSVSFADGFDISSIDTHKPGEYTVKLKSGLFKYNAKLTVVDTEAPVGEAVNKTLKFGEAVDISELVTNITDATEVALDYETAPDFTRNGSQTVSIKLTDLGENVTVLSAVIFIDPMKPTLQIKLNDPAPDIKDLCIAGADTKGLIPVTPLESIDTSKAGNFTLEFIENNEHFYTVLQITENDPPEVEAKSVTSYVGADISPEDFIESCNDSTEVTFSFVTSPDLNLVGTQTVTIRATDIFDNYTDVQAELVLADDAQPPTIIGVRDINAYLGDAISYLSGVNVKDDYDSNVKIEVDTSAVDFANAGVYDIIYIATDHSGNSSSVKAKLNTIEKTIDESVVTELADRIIREITDDSMSAYNKLRAIYNWLRKNISYRDTDEKDDWIAAAYMGLHDNKGDCFIYQSAAKVLLDAAGIENKLIDTVPLRYLHCWNLVNIGDGWYHFDATPRVGGFDGLYLTDSTLKKYSDSHKNSHIYDREKYTDIVE